MDILDKLKTLSITSLKSCSHNSLRNYFKVSADEIQSLRQQLAVKDLEVMQLREALEASKNVLEIAMTDRDGNKFMYLNTRSGSVLSALDTLDKCNQTLSTTFTPDSLMDWYKEQLGEVVAYQYMGNKDRFMPAYSLGEPVTDSRFTPLYAPKLNTKG